MRDDDEKEEGARALREERGLKDLIGERNLLGLPKDFDSDDVSEPGTIKSA